MRVLCFSLKMAKCRCSKSCFISTSVIGIILVVAGSVLLGLDIAEKLINDELNKQLVLSLDSPAYSQWINPAPPIYMQYWVYNVTNPAKIIKGEKPKLEEIGPFTYRLYQPKFDDAFYGNNSVSYKYNHTIVYQRDMSAHDPIIPVTQLNIPLLTVQSLAKNLPSWAPTNIVDLLAEALDDSDIFVQHTVEELLFGYEDPIFNLVHDILALAKIDFPPYFGLFLGFNNSDDGVYTVNSGRKDIMQTNVIEKWNGEANLTYWSTPEANMINGTDGVFMNPKLKSDETLYIFNTDLCRSVFLKFQSQTLVQGIKTLRFQLPREAFSNATENPHNAGFCVPKGNCLDAGVQSISPCREGAPIALSSPHFYLGADKYINGVDAEKPAQENDETYLDIEPLTGAVFSAMKRMQVNVNVQKSDLLPQMDQMKDVMMPVLWLNESVVLDEGTADLFKSEVLTLLNFVRALPYVILGLGIFLFVLGIGLFFRARKLVHKDVPLLSNEGKSTD